MNEIVSKHEPFNYNGCKKSLAIANLSNFFKITVYGPSSIELINHYSIRDLNRIKENSFYTILMKRKKFIDEVLIIKLSPIKYVVITENFKKTMKYLSKVKRKFPLVTVEDTTYSYSLFSFHGSKSREFLNNNPSNNLYLTLHQQYPYYVLLTSNINKFQTLDHYKELGFSEINSEIRNIFLYNNKVITKLETIKKKYALNTYLSLYPFDNVSFNFEKHLKPKKLVLVKQFETTKNILVNKGMKIQDNKRSKVGYVHNFYRLPNKKNPYVLGIVQKEKTEKLAIIKYNNQEVIIKEYINY